MRAPLGCSHILATVYSVAMSIHVHVFCLNTCFQFFWHGASGSYGNSVFNFGGAGKLVSKEDVPFHIPSTLYALLFIYTSLPTLIIFCLHFFFCFTLWPSYRHIINVSFREDHCICPSWRMDWVGAHGMEIVRI